MPENDETNLDILSPVFADEEEARRFIELKRWPNGPVCPHCDSLSVYTLTARTASRKPARPGVFKCARCRKQFTVRIRTIFQESKLALHKWLFAIQLMTSSEKGVSSRQIARKLGITVKSALFLTRRLRQATTEQPLAGLLHGHVEVDENCELQ